MVFLLIYKQFKEAIIYYCGKTITKLLAKAIYARNDIVEALKKLINPREENE
jgi:hypothetical protein